jgi:hypothetical protein
MANDLKTISLPDTIGVPLKVDDWVVYATDVFNGQLRVGQVARFNEKSIIVKRTRGKNVRLTSSQLIKVSEEQLTLY